MTTPEAVCEWGKGTRWCTGGDSDGLENAEMYLASGSLFLFLRNEGGKWQKYAQCTKDLDQVMNVLDKKDPNPPESFIKLLKKLIDLGYFKQFNFYNYMQNVNYSGIDEDFISYFNYIAKNSINTYSTVLIDIFNYVRKFGRLKSVEDKLIFSNLKLKFLTKKFKNNFKEKYNEDLPNSGDVIDGDHIKDYFDSIDFWKKRWPNKEQEDFIAKTDYAINY